MARKVMDDLVKKGKVTRVAGCRVSTHARAGKSFGVSGEGVLVNQVMPKSPARPPAPSRRPHPQRGRKVIKEPRELQRVIADVDIGKSIELNILRQKEKRVLKAQIGEMPAS